jgi:serine/threonine protein kinase
MAVVLRSYDRELHRHVAVKILSKSVADDPLFRKRFQREARHVASLAHPNIVRVYDVGADGGLSFIVMEYVDGQSLDQCFNSGDLPSVSHTAILTDDVLSALEHAHGRGIVHRDIKPGNILVSPDGTAKVADFGVAKSAGDTTEITVHGSFVGTAAYASPEQLMGRLVGRSSDLYSLGCVLYQCLAGRPPFPAGDVDRLVMQHRFAEVEPIQSIRPDVPGPIASAIMVALSKDPADRFTSAQDMRVAFSHTTGTDDHLITTTSRNNVEWQHPPNVDAAEPATVLTLPTNVSAPLSPTSVLADDQRRQARGIRRISRRRLTIATTITVAALVAAVSLSLTSNDRVSGIATLPASGKIPSGGFLKPGESIRTQNAQFTLSMQTDGNLVEYADHHGPPVWESGTSGNFGAYAVMQADGDFVVYPHGQSAPPPGQPTPALWSSGTYGHPGSYVELEGNGTTVMRTAGGSTFWRSVAPAHPLSAGGGN